MDEKNRRVELPHHIVLEARSRLMVSGVEDVESFDEQQVVMYTSKGLLVIKGHELHVDKLSIEGGEVSIEGTVDSLQYEEEQKTTGSFWSRLFR